MQDSIGEGALKIACIQTAPGRETEVKADLETACKENKEVRDFSILKGIGTFDLVLIYSTSDFGANVRKAGPFKHILKSNALLCYSFIDYI